MIMPVTRHRNIYSIDDRTQDSIDSTEVILKVENLSVIDGSIEKEVVNVER
jgi:hypothetical protein